MNYNIILLTRIFLLNRRFLVLISLLILLISIPIVLLLTQKSQDIRQRASEIPGSIQVTTVDANGSFYGTYQSHNQKIVSNQNGIFMTYVHQTIDKDQPTEQDTWRLVRSTDNGQTFTTIYEATSATRSPVIETDAQNNIYLIQVDWSKNNTPSYFYMFSASNNYQSPTKQTTISLGTFSAKYAMEIDEARNQLYYFTLGNTFTILNLDGTIKKQYQLTQNGSIAGMHYPYLYLDENGYLYVAWTTTPPDGSNYHSIHFIRSKDGGNTWEKSNGQALSIPIIADETGTTDRVNLDDEYGATWLETMIVKAGKIHFMYYARPPLNRMHYVRYDLVTGNKDDIYPFKGETITFAGWDGFCTTDRLQNTGIYCINRNFGPYALAVLKSDDNGTTWHDYAIAPTPQNEIYAIGGSPLLTNDRSIIGSFTESSNFQDPTAPKIVKFFRAAPATATSTSTPTPLIGDFNKNGTVDEDDYKLWKEKFVQNATDPNTLNTIDANNNGTIDIGDFNIWRENNH